MRNTTWMNQCNVPAGTIIRGKWHGHSYTVIKKLGNGANGVVYLARGKNGNSALKMGRDSAAMISEVNVLKAFSKVRGVVLGPSLLDVDDWRRGQGQLIPFYVMEYIEGPDLLSFIRMKGESWSGVLIVQLLEILANMHRQGWVFGDLKPENLIVSNPPPRIRCIDVGGTTKVGRSIKEFTEFYDRGYWGLGSRKAEPSYDFFSAAMMMIHLHVPKKFTKKGDGLDQLNAVISNHPDLSRYKHVLLKAIGGRYKQAEQMKSDLLDVISYQNSRTGRNASGNPLKPCRKKGTFLETLTVLFVTLFLYGMYIYFFLF